MDSSRATELSGTRQAAPAAAAEAEAEGGEWQTKRRNDFASDREQSIDENFTSRFKVEGLFSRLGIIAGQRRQQHQHQR